MTLARTLALLAAAAALAGCIRTQAGGDGVFEPTRVEPPPSERGSGLGRGAAEEATPSADQGRSPGRRLAVPSR
jgi:hypothetical protein